MKSSRQQDAAQRDRAWRARQAARRAAENAGRSQIATWFDRELARAQARERALEEERDRALSELAHKIAELQVARDQLRQRFAAPLADAHQCGVDIVARRNAAWQELDEWLNREFPDMTGAARWTSVPWQPPLDGAARKALEQEDTDG